MRGRRRWRGRLPTVALVVLAAAGCTADEGVGQGAAPTTGSARSTPSGPAGPGLPSTPARTPTTAPTGEVPGAAAAPPTFATDAPGRQDSVLARLPGSSAERCVPVADLRDVRSGSMAAGNFADARAAFAAHPDAAIPFYFIPGGVEGEPSLRVTLARPDGTSPTRVASANLETLDVWRYYRVTIPVPDEGRWRLTATAGADKGCWDLVLGS